MRMEAAQLFVTSIHKPSRTRLTPVRVKQLYRIEDIPGLISNNLEYRYKYLTKAYKQVLFCYLHIRVYVLYDLNI